MAKINRVDANIFDIPAGANTTKTGAVYINNGNYRIEPTDGRKAFTSHVKICIGVTVNSSQYGHHNSMYGNDNYYRLFVRDQLPEPPAKADSIAVGPRALTEALSDEHELIERLAEVFGGDDAALIMDLATYMLVEEKAVFQHYPSWARRHAIYSSTIRSDSYLKFEAPGHAARYCLVGQEENRGLMNYFSDRTEYQRSRNKERIKKILKRLLY